MRAAFEPTWNRLTDHERDVFMRLSVFGGGFTREAAKAVAGASLRTLSALVDKSLLKVDANGRYDLHELLRQFAAEKLSEADEVETAAQRHFDYFLTFAEQVEAHNFGREQIAWYDRAEGELDNLRVALAWSTQGGEAETSLRLAVALGWFFTERSHWHEGFDWMEHILAANPDVYPTLRAKALQTAGVLAWFIGSRAYAERCLNESIILARATGDRWNLAWALSHLGLYVNQGGDPTQVAELQEESLTLFRELDDAMGITHLLVRRFWPALAQNDYSYVRRLLKEANERAQRAGDQVMIAWVTYNLAWLAKEYDNDVPRAKALFETSVVLFRQARLQMGVNNALIWLGILDVMLGNNFEAQALFQEVLVSLRDIEPNHPYLSDTLATLGSIATMRGQFERAVYLFAAACRINEVRVRRSDNFDANLATVRAQLGTSYFEQVWATGSLMTTAQAIAYALEAESGLTITTGGAVLTS